MQNKITLSPYQQKMLEELKKGNQNYIYWGGRLSGKSTVEEILKECGYYAK